MILEVVVTAASGAMVRFNPHHGVLIQPDGSDNGVLLSMRGAALVSDMASLFSRYVDLFENPEEKKE